MIPGPGATASGPVRIDRRRVVGTTAGGPSVADRKARPTMPESHRFLAVAVALWLATAGLAPAATLSVPDDHPTLAAAMLASVAGDTIQLAPGTYTEHGIALVAGVTVLGDPDDPAAVVLDAGGQGRILDAFGLAIAPELRGLTFTGGSTLDGWWEALGGAVRCRSSALIVRDCVFTDNEAVLGGGLGCLDAELTITDTVFHANRGIGTAWTAGGGLYVDDSSGSVVRCDFTDNTAFAVDLPGDAAGFYSESSQMLVQFCTFTGNSTGAGGAGFYSYLADSPVLEDCHFEDNHADFGGAIYLENSSAVLRRCTVVNNTAKTAGGALIDDGSVCEIVDSVFAGNVATHWAGGAIGAWVADLTIIRTTFTENQTQSVGGAVSLRAGSGYLEDCLIARNAAGVRGGALNGSLTHIEVVGSTLVANAAPSAGGIALQEDASVQLVRTIVARSSSGESIVAQESGAVTASCTVIFANAGGDWLGDWAYLLGTAGNRNVNPVFCQPDAGDYHLAENSPCAPPNSGVCGLIGALPVGCDPVGVPADEAVPAALRLEPSRPNPFNPRTTVTFVTPTTGPVRVAIHDARGRLVRVLNDGRVAAGRHALTWDGRDGRGQGVASGVYLVVVEGAAGRDAHKITLAR